MTAVYDPDREKEPRDVWLGRQYAEMRDNPTTPLRVAEPSLTREELEASLIDRDRVTHYNSEGTWVLEADGWVKIS